MELTLYNLNKSFGDKKAVNNLSIKLGPGIHGLLGANGAGKTTFMRILCGILKPSSGNIELNKRDILKMGEKYLEILSYQPQHFGYYPNFTGLEYLDYIGAVRGLSKAYTVKRANELCDIFQLSDMKNKKIKTYSGGMIQRLGLIQAMLNDPKILVLDEPTAGQNISNNIILMKSGKIICYGDESTLLSQLKGKVWDFVIDEGRLLEYMKKHLVINYSRDVNKIKLRVISDNSPTSNATLLQPNLEDLYLYYNPEQVE